MDPVWTMAVSLITPYVAKAGEAVAEKVGENLFDSIKKRFEEKKDTRGKKALASFRREPQVYAGALEKTLELRSQDREFHSWLSELVTLAQRDIAGSGTGSHNSVRQEIKGHAKVGGSVIGVVSGDVHIENNKPGK